ncbi:MAG: chalcone isomerase family protein [Undibacterium sp.]|nr:chalcone isomerase family protein [Undibacterium sp.]
MRKSFIYIILALTIGMSHVHAYADRWRQDLPQAKLIGSGDLRWFGLHIYSARLWTESATFDPKSSFALELTYQRNITRERFVDTSVDEIKRLYGNGISNEVLQRWRSHMEKAFTDVKSGDQLIGVHLPKIGCRFYSRDKLLAEIKDTDFADAFFAIWFDPRSKDSGLRKQLTGAKP